MFFFHGKIDGCESAERAGQALVEPASFMVEEAVQPKVNKDGGRPRS
jgi:hypothetical protein